MGGINSGFPWYWGLHFANNLNYAFRGVQKEIIEDSKTLCKNVVIYDNLEMSAVKAIKKGQEIFLNYRYKTTSTVVAAANKKLVEI